MSEQNLSIEERYKEMDEIEHILNKPGMYIGSIYSEMMKYRLFVPSENRIRLLDNIAYNAGLLKLFDEVFTNSIDERRRKTRLFNIDKIHVEVNTNGTIVIKDNGGIPVQIHKDAGMYLPKFIFGKLRTSANYSQDREGAGINGIGAKIANIYSHYFRLTTSDGAKMMDIQWSNNMRDIDFEEVTNSSSKDNHFSRFEFKIQLERFEVKELDIATIRIIQKRIIDACASNLGLEVVFESNVAEGRLNSTWCFNSFEEYVRLYLIDQKQQLITWTNPVKGDVVVLTQDIDANIGFVNGNPCNDGTHMKKIRDQVIDYLLPKLQKDGMELLTDRDLINKLSVFTTISILNPDYASQTKEKLTCKIGLDILKFNKQFLAELDDSDYVKDIVEFYKAKYLAEQKKALKKLNSQIKLTKSKKFIPCASKVSSEKEFWMFEGESAKGGFESNRDTLRQSAYQLRGKILNVIDLPKAKIVENLEMREILSILNLQFDSPKHNLANVSAHKIVIASDADYDGDHIAGLWIVFFAMNFPEIIRAGYLYRALSPLVVIKNRKSKEEIVYWTNEEWEKDKKLYNDLKKYKINYYKGLGGLPKEYYDELMNKQRLIKLELTPDFKKTIEIWFSKDTELRKAILAEEGMLEDDED